MHNPLRYLPSVDKLLHHEKLASFLTTYGHQLVVETIRNELALARQHLLNGTTSIAIDELIAKIVTQLQTTVTPSLQPVINATGVIIHTNLGRVLLAKRAILAMNQVATAYSNLEYDLTEGRRGSRYLHAVELLCKLTGAEAAVVVNNNAAAVILALTVLAQHREVIISRSQLVEIGGGFRIPDIMKQSGATLVEVGTTNRTYIRDYEQAIVDTRTGLLLTVHHSNYQITGFTAQPTLQELATLSHHYHLPLMEDLGSGTLLDTKPYGLIHEPTIQESIQAGVDLVTASGDKLLGGPQAGLILGRADLIEQIKQHPLIRAFRVDKTTLAALQATLLVYMENKAVQELPVWRMIATNVTELTQRVTHWRDQLLGHSTLSETNLQCQPNQSTIGGGSLPGQTLPTTVLAVNIASPHQWATTLRQASPPIITRIEDGQLILDPRTVLPEQDETLISTLRQTFNQPEGV